MTVVAAFCLLVLLAFPAIVSGWCLDDTDHDPNTRRKIDCRKNPDAAGSQRACQSLCYAESWCQGTVWIGSPAHWVKGKYCCFLKDRYNPSALKSQKHRRYCRRGY
ncbi:hypothetical protein CBR_g8178 [Chara braunii]|uniref:Apple domain-containing protein n=1 Tax=Chara braunii TaxID=69332 RepID=A0A388KLK6_CHABU|nr:hypothetical protein CBR_g8178 [Chara braunii]|eukprot:GBG70878.1 hypothetical protein CBR_g8178 [Chara braunii]